MKHIFLIVPLLVLVCALNCSVQAELPERTALPQGMPDFTKGEGPSLKDVGRGKWYLHCAMTRGHIYEDNAGEMPGRQILVTTVPVTSNVRYDLKEGDVILGVNGEYFTGHAVQQFRKASLPVNKTGGTLDVILWRPGWDRERQVTLDLSYKPIDFTRGDVRGKEVDWNLGPTGARGWMQGKNFESFITRQILITSVEEGSPADRILQPGDVILGIGDRKFTSDARKRFGEAIAAAETEAGRGKLELLRWRDGETQIVTIPLPVMGSYSDSAPWDCEKSQRILKNACDYIIENDIINQQQTMHIISLVGAMAMLSTGEDEHMQVAKTFIDKLVKLTEESGSSPPILVFATWDWGYANILLTEYYLLTGDESVLPAIRKFSEAIARGQSGAGTWGHRMALPNHGPCHGYGALNQAGNMCLLSLALAQRCGVTSPAIERAVREGSSFLKQFVDLQPIPYGDHPKLDPTGHDDNGKCSQGAVIFSITGDLDAFDFYTRMTIASHAVREWGHTGNWWNFLWGPLGAVRGGQPACSAFLKEQRWLFDLERRWDGGFIYQGKMTVGYGRDERGRQRSGSEHTTGHWDTTVARVLMYALPQKRLVITGKDALDRNLNDDEIAMLIDAGQRPPQDDQEFQAMYDGLDADVLMKKLKHWSPVVRNFAALSLAKTEGDYVSQLIAMLDSDNRFAQYGACSALRRIGPDAVPAVNALIDKLNADDHLLQIRASAALGAIGDQRALEPLLQLIAGPIDNDPREMVRRMASRALLERGGLLSDSIDGVDRELLFAATRKLLKVKGGQVRSNLARAVLERLTLEEMQELWPDVIPALREVAPTEIMFASGVRISIAQKLADNHIEEGMALIFEYLKTQKPHGSTERSKLILDLLKSYDAAARPMLPELEAYLEFCKQEFPWTDKGQPPPQGFYSSKVPHLEAAIKHIRNAEAQPDLISIQEHLK